MEHCLLKIILSIQCSNINRSDITMVRMYNDDAWHRIRIQYPKLWNVLNNINLSDELKLNSAYTFYSDLPLAVLDSIEEQLK